MLWSAATTYLVWPGSRCIRVYWMPRQVASCTTPDTGASKSFAQRPPAQAGTRAMGSRDPQGKAQRAQSAKRLLNAIGVRLHHWLLFFFHDATAALCGAGGREAGEYGHSVWSSVTFHGSNVGAVDRTQRAASGAVCGETMLLPQVAADETCFSRSTKTLTDPSFLLRLLL